MYSYLSILFLRNITGEIINITHGNSIGATASGVFQRKNGTTTGNARGGGTTESFKFDSSTVIDTSDENRPVNVAMTPVIFY